MTCRPVVPLLLAILSAVLAAPPVSYRITARLDEPARTVTGTEDVLYRNLSPDTLHSIWFHTFANAFSGRRTEFGRELERSGRFDLGLAERRELGSLSILRVRAAADELRPVFHETEMEVPLDTWLAPGDSIRLTVDFTLRIPAPFAELGMKGRSYLLAHWHPQVAARGSEGWHVDGYHLFGSSPGEFADYRVTLTLPPDLTVAATGRLLSPTEEVMRQRLPPNLRPQTPDSNKTIEFKADNVPGFALSTSPRFVLLTDSVPGTRINIFARHPANPDWRGAVESACDIVNYYSSLYGPCPFPELDIVQADGVAPADASFPGLVIMAQRPIPATRLFEQALARQIALQWFSCALGPDELREPWIARGPAARAEMRYMEAKYGTTNLIDQPLFERLFAGLNAEYYHRLYDYVATSNDLMVPLSTSAADYTERFSFDAASLSHAGLAFREAERALGTTEYDARLRNYVQTNRGLRPDGRTVAASFPEVAVFDSAGTPAGKDLWNNGSGRKVTIHPIIALPSFDSYQLFYGPYAWIDNYHGVQLQAWAQGRQFVEAGPLRGRHMWTLSETYSTKIDDWHTGFSYTTPLECISKRLRLLVGLDYSLMDAGAKANLVHEFGPVFGQPRLIADIGYRFLDLYNLRFRDTLAWDSAAFSDVRLKLTHTYEQRLFKGSQRLYFARGLTELGGDFDYWKTSIEQTHTFRWRLNSGITLRLFAGSVLGSIPNQEQFYLSGGLTATSSEPVSWGYQGWTSGQARWHYDADANLRGYAGEYIHGRHAWGVNLYFAPVNYIQPFFDIGNVADTLGRSLLQPRMDAGLRLRFGPLYADFPFWRWHPGSSGHEFAFRWMLGLKLSEVTQ